MLHSDLQPFYWRFRHVGVMVRFRWLALLINFLLKRFAAGKDIDGLDCEERFVPSADGAVKYESAYISRGNKRALYQFWFTFTAVGMC